MELNVGNVFEFGFNKSGRFLALLIDAADQAGNGLQIRDMSAGTISSLDTDKAFYERMTWTQEGDAISMLKGTDELRSGWLPVNPCRRKRTETRLASGIFHHR